VATTAADAAPEQRHEQHADDGGPGHAEEEDRVRGEDVDDGGPLVEDVLGSDGDGGGDGGADTEEDEGEQRDEVVDRLEEAAGPEGDETGRDADAGKDRTDKVADAHGLVRGLECRHNTVDVSGREADLLEREPLQQLALEDGDRVEREREGRRRAHRHALLGVGRVCRCGRVVAQQQALAPRRHVRRVEVVQAQLVRGRVQPPAQVFCRQ